MGSSSLAPNLPRSFIPPLTPTPELTISESLRQGLGVALLSSSGITAHSPSVLSFSTGCGVEGTNLLLD